MIRNKVSMFLATLIVASTIGGLNVQQVEAKEVTISNSKLQLANGEYSAKNVTSYIDSSNATGQKMARSVVNEVSNISIKDGVIKVTVKFNDNMFGYLKDINVSLNGKKIESKINTNDKSMTFEVPEIDSKVLINMTVTAMGRNVSLYLQNDLNSVSLIK